MKQPQPIDIEDAQVEQLIRKAEQGTLDSAEQKRLVPLLKTLVWLQRSLLETRISLSKLRRILFGKKTEKRPRKPKHPDNGSDGGENGSDEGPGSHDPPAQTADLSQVTPQDEQSGASKAKQSRGHGRRAAADYPGAERVFCAHDEYRPGDRCPKCERGRLYTLPPLVRLRCLLYTSPSPRDFSCNLV